MQNGGQKPVTVTVEGYGSSLLSNSAAFWYIGEFCVLISAALQFGHAHDALFPEFAFTAKMKHRGTARIYTYIHKQAKMHISIHTDAHTHIYAYTEKKHSCLHT
jgi:hypothetical protein